MQNITREQYYQTKAFGVRHDDPDINVLMAPCHIYTTLSQARHYAFWEFREAARLQGGVYKPLPTAVKDNMELYLTSDQLALMHKHYLHTAENGTMVAYTASAGHGEHDRQTVTKLGRYLTRTLGVSSGVTVKAISEVYATDKNLNLAANILFTSDPDDIADIYASGEPESCMAKSTSHWNSGVHPCSVYHPDDWELVYMVDDDYGDCTGRMMTAKNKKEYYGAYGNCQEIEAYLVDSGYVQTTDISEGLRLLRVPYRSTFIAPYVDGNSRDVVDDGEVLWMTRGSAHGTNVVGNSQSSYDTGGLVASDKSVDCHHCRVTWVIGTNENYQGGGYLCESCIGSHYVRLHGGGLNLRTRSVYSRAMRGWLDGASAVSFTRNGRSDFATNDHLVVEITSGLHAIGTDCYKVEGDYYYKAQCTLIEGRAYLKKWVKNGVIKGRMVGKYDLETMPISEFKTLYFKAEKTSTKHRLITGVSKRSINEGWLSYDEIFMSNPAPRKVRAVFDNKEEVIHVFRTGNSQVQYNLLPDLTNLTFISEHYSRELTYERTS